MSVRLPFTLAPVLSQGQESCLYLCIILKPLDIPWQNEYGHLQVSSPHVVSAPFLCLCMSVHAK